MNPRVTLFWDIDGTLLTTARAGVFSLEDALEQLTGIRASLEEATTAGLTDYAIAEAALRSVGDEAPEERVLQFLRIHGEQLHAYLGRRQGSVLPNVREILGDLAAREDVVNLLLTGNIEAGAWAKLRHYGIAEFFRGGAFCAGPGERTDIARRAAELADGLQHAFVIGDTPHDIAAGNSIGARTVAVATGTYSLEQLEAHGPWAAVDELPRPDAFRALLEID